MAKKTETEPDRDAPKLMQCFAQTGRLHALVGFISFRSISALHCHFLFHFHLQPSELSCLAHFCPQRQSAGRGRAADQSLKWASFVCSLPSALVMDRRVLGSPVLPATCQVSAGQ